MYFNPTSIFGFCGKGLGKRGKFLASRYSFILLGSAQIGSRFCIKCLCD
jgi:hypothetical protein